MDLSDQKMCWSQPPGGFQFFSYSKVQRNPKTTQTGWHRVQRRTQVNKTNSVQHKPAWSGRDLPWKVWRAAMAGEGPLEDDGERKMGISVFGGDGSWIVTARAAWQCHSISCISSFKSIQGRRGVQYLRAIIQLVATSSCILVEQGKPLFQRIL